MDVGPWATEKLECLRKYLQAYTRILGNQQFRGCQRAGAEHEEHGQHPYFYIDAAFPFGEPPGDVDEHGLQRLAVHVEGLLAEVGGLGREVTQFAAVMSDAPGDLEQAVAVVGDGAHRRGAVRIAAQRAEVDKASDHGIRLTLRRADGTELRQLVSPPRVAAASGRP